MYLREKWKSNYDIQNDLNIKIISYFLFFQN